MMTRIWAILLIALLGEIGWIQVTGRRLDGRGGYYRGSATNGGNRRYGYSFGNTKPSSYGGSSSRAKKPSFWGYNFGSFAGATKPSSGGFTFGSSSGGIESPKKWVAGANGAWPDLPENRGNNGGLNSRSFSFFGFGRPNRRWGANKPTYGGNTNTEPDIPYNFNGINPYRCYLPDGTRCDKESRVG